MLTVALVVALLPAAVEGPRPRVLVLDVRSEGDAQLAALLGNEVAAELARGGALDVVTSDDLRRLADVAATRESTGCDDDGACLAEIGAAMGARYVVSGVLGRVGASTLVQLSLFDVERGRSIARESAQAATTEAIASTTRELSARLRRALVSETPAPMPVLPLAVAGGGAALAFVGIVVAAIAYPIVIDASSPANGGPKPEDRQTAQVLGAGGVVFAGAGVAAIGAGALLFVLGVGE